MQSAKDVSALRVECEEWGVPVAGIQTCQPATLQELLGEARRLEDSSLEELREECMKEGFADSIAELSARVGVAVDAKSARERLVLTLKHILVWKRSDLASLQQTCKDYGLVVESPSSCCVLLKALAHASWEVVGIPAGKLQSLQVAHALLDQVRRLEAMSFAELAKLCREKRIPRPWAIKKGVLVVQLRRDLVWRQMSFTQLRMEYLGSNLGNGGSVHATRGDMIASLTYSTWAEVFRACDMATCQSALDRWARTVQAYHDMLEDMPDDTLDVSYQQTCSDMPLQPGRRRLEMQRRLMDLFVLYKLAVPELQHECSGRGIASPPKSVSRQTLVKQLMQQSCLQDWEMQGIPACTLGFKLAAQVVATLADLEGKSLSDLRRMYQAYGMQAHRKMERRLYLSCLRQLAIEEALLLAALQLDGTPENVTKSGRGWRARLIAHACRSRGLPEERLDSFQASLCLVMRHDKIETMSRRDLLAECKVVGIPTQGAVADGDLRRRLRRFELRRALSWDGLFQDCADCDVSILEVCWFNPRQEQEQRKALALQCLRHECLSEFEAKGLPAHRIGDFDALLALAGQCELLNAMPDEDLMEECAERGLPEMSGVRRSDMLAALMQCLIWQCLPTEELEKECRERCRSARVLGSRREVLVEYLLLDMCDRANWLEGVPAKRLGSLVAAKQLDTQLRALEDMDNRELASHYSRQGFPNAGQLHREQLLQRLSSAELWAALPKEELRVECTCRGLHVERPKGGPRQPPDGRAAELLRDLLLLDLFERDVERLGIPARSVGSFAVCSRLVKSVDEIDALDEPALTVKYAGLGLSSIGLSKNEIVKRLKTVACMEGSQRLLQNECRAMGMNSIVMGASDHAKKVRLLAHAKWKDPSADSLIPEELPSEPPSESDLQRLLAVPRRPDVAMPEEAQTWGWWEWLLFFQSQGSLDPRAVAAKRKAQEPSAACGGGECCERISVVVPTMSSRRCFHQQLWSVFDAQTWPDKELIVVDTYSEDPSPFLSRKAEEDERVVYAAFKVQRHADFSIGLKRNLCTYLASGAVLANFDDDDVYAPRYLETMVGELRAQKRDAITLSSWYMFDCSTGKMGQFDPQKLVGRHDTGTLDGWTYGYGFSYVYPRCVALRTPYPNWSFDEDSEFISRVAQSAQRKEPWSIASTRASKSAAIALLPDTFGLCLHLLHADSTSDAWAYREIPEDERKALEVFQLSSLGIDVDSWLSRFLRTKSFSNFVADSEQVRYQELLVRGGARAPWKISCLTGSLVSAVKLRLLEAVAPRGIGIHTCRACRLRGAKATRTCSSHGDLSVDIYPSYMEFGSQDGLPMQEDERISLRTTEIWVVFSTRGRANASLVPRGR